MEATTKKQSMKKSRLFVVGISICVFLITAFVLIGAKFLTAKTVPFSKIQENLIESAIYFSDKDMYQFLDERMSMNKVVDNKDDAIELSIISHVTPEHSIRDTLTDSYYIDEEMGGAYALYLSANQEAETNYDYFRYWHGSTSIARVLLQWMDIQGIRWSLFGVISLLLLISLVMLLRKKQIGTAVILVLTQLVIGYWYVRTCIEYEDVYLAMALILPFYIWLEAKSDSYLTYLAVASGVMVAYFDFLTYETIAFLIPMLVVFAMRHHDGRENLSKESLLLLTKNGVIYVFSYGMMYLLKWVLASIAVGHSVIGEAAASAAVRIAEESGFENISPVAQFFLAPFANLSAFYGGVGRVEWGRIVGGLLLSVLIVGSVFYLFYQKDKKTQLNKVLLFIIALPFVRFLVLSNHSYLHNFFTFRALQCSVMAIFVLVYVHCDFNRKKKR